jgi:UDP-glucose 4-epimerase
VRIVLTGATGFIGSHLLPVLAERHDVVAIARGAHAEMPAVTWVDHDLRRPLSEAKLPATTDAVLHLAQSRRYRDFPSSANDIFALNVRATFDLLEYARRARASRFVFASTGGVYGHGDESFVEEDAVNPINFYLASKYAAETMIAPYVGELRAIVLRLFFVYGPGQGQMLVSSLARRVLRGETITISGDPGIRINPLYVGDAVRVFERALEHESSLLCNVAGDEVVDLRRLVGMLGELAGTTPLVEHAPAEHEGDIVGDTRRMKAALGVWPDVPLCEGLARLIESLR